MDKSEFRSYIRKLKKHYSKEDLQRKSIQVINNINSETVFRNAKIVMCYWSLDDEVSTHGFIEKWHLHKTILLPVIEKEHLIIKQFHGLKSMKPDSKFGILEPTGVEFKEIENIDLIIVPGIAFDKNKNRLGRGKAFYDKLLPKLKCPKAGICFDFQFVDNVPINRYDIAMDMVITESIILK